MASRKLRRVLIAVDVELEDEGARPGLLLIVCCIPCQTLLALRTFDVDLDQVDARPVAGESVERSRS